MSDRFYKLWNECRELNFNVTLEQWDDGKPARAMLDEIDPNMPAYHRRQFQAEADDPLDALEAALEEAREVRDD